MDMKRVFTVMLLLFIVALVAGCGSTPAPAVQTPIPPKPPVLLSAAPADGSTVQRDASVILDFDEPMDAASLARAVSFSPESSFDVLVTENRAELRPNSLWSQGTNYRFNLQGGTAVSSEGAVLEAGLSLAFSTARDPITMTIDRLGYTDNILEGATADEITAAMGNGVGHFPGLGRPGVGNFVIFAHASGQVSFPYNRLFDLVPGDLLLLEYGGRTWTYRMTKGFVVYQDELWILDQTEAPLITFFVCSSPEGQPSPTFHPLYRYVVRADLLTSPN